MKKMKLTRSLLAACSIVALAAVMYGCESSGPSQTEFDEEKARAEAAEAAQAEAEAQAAAEAEAKAAAEAAAEAAAAARTAAEAAQAAAEAQAAEDAAAAEAAEAAAAAAAAEAAEQAKAAAAAEAAQEAAQAQAQAAADAATAALAAAEAAQAAAAAAATAQEEAEAAQEAAEDAEEKAAEELADELAKQKAAKLGALFRGLLRQATTDPVFTPFAANPTIEAAHGMVANIYAPDIGVEADPDVGSDAAFALVKPTALDALGDWTGADIMATNADGVVDHVNVYTDVNVGDEISFEKLFPETAGAAGDALRVNNAFVEPTRIVNAAGLNMHQGLHEAQMENDDGEMVDVFQTGSGTKTHGSPSLQNEVFAIPGTFAGVSGIYRCAEGATGNNNCQTSGTNLGTSFGGEGVDGAPPADGAGAWTFNPDSEQDAEVPDGDYAYFGWWLRIGADGAWDVDAFHGVEGLLPVDANPDPALTGSATYKGQAAGKAAINPQLPGEALMGGAFTADATLTADFEADDGITATTDERGMISGMIDNFMVDGEEADWTVALGATPIIYGALTTDPAVTDIAGGSTTWMIDGKGSSSNGTWSGNFYDASAADGVPKVVTGEFTATYNNQVGRMEGAFGANRE